MQNKHQYAIILEAKENADEKNINEFMNQKGYVKEVKGFFISPHENPVITIMEMSEIKDICKLAKLIRYTDEGNIV